MSVEFLSLNELVSLSNIHVHTIKEIRERELVI